MLVVWLLLLVVMMRSCMVLVGGPRHGMREQTVLVEIGGVHGGKDGGRRYDVVNRTLR